MGGLLVCFWVFGFVYLCWVMCNFVLFEIILIGCYFVYGSFEELVCDNVELIVMIEMMLVEVVVEGFLCLIEFKQIQIVGWVMVYGFVWMNFDGYFLCWGVVEGEIEQMVEVVIDFFIDGIVCCQW